MDIIIRLNPRKIERVVFILILIALICSNIYFYKKQGPEQAGTAEDDTVAVAGDQEQTSEPAQEQNKQEIKQNTTQKTTPKQNQTQNATQKTGNCTKGWKCKTPYYKGYQNSDCSWESIEACVDGCTDGACNVNVTE